MVKMMIVKIVLTVFLVLTSAGFMDVHAADGFGNVGENGVYFSEQDHPALDSSAIDAAEFSQMEPAAGGDDMGAGIAPSGINSQMIEHYFGEALNGYARDPETTAPPATE